MSAVDSSMRPYATGYLLDELVMTIARENGHEVYGHGGDFNFWGTDLLPGLFSRKSACGMLPMPDGKVQAFKVINQKNAQKRTGTHLLIEMQGKDLLDTYFQKNADGWSGPASELYKPTWKFPNTLIETFKQLRVRQVGETKQAIQHPESRTLSDI